jgi:hypothetical protein
LIVLIIEEAIIFFAVELLQKTSVAISCGVTRYEKLLNNSKLKQEDDVAHQPDATTPLISNKNEVENKLKKKASNLNLHVVGMK